MPYKDDIEYQSQESVYDVAIVTSVNRLDVPESGTATYNVNLSGLPRRKGIKVSVNHASGDSGITVASGLTYYFNSSTWNIYQP
jgi:hypothetical protein